MTSCLINKAFASTDHLNDCGSPLFVNVFLKNLTGVIQQRLWLIKYVVVEVERPNTVAFKGQKTPLLVVFFAPRIIFIFHARQNACKYIL